MRAGAAALLGGALALGTAVSPVSANVAEITAPGSLEAAPILGHGASGPQVAYVQALLSLSPTGYFGDHTRAAVADFQHRSGDPVTGVVEAPTWAKLGVAHVVDPAAIPAGLPADQPRVAGVLATAASLAGVPYRYGGTSTSGFDCSGYVGHVFRANGVELPRTSGAIRGATATVAASDVRPGDLVFVHSGGGRVSHVGIVSADGRWWEATRPGRPVALNKPWTSSVSYGRV